MNISLINPQSITIPSGPIAFGQEVIQLKYDGELLAKLQMDGRSSPEAALIKQAVPRSIINAIKSQQFRGEGIRLNPKYITHLKRRAKGYQAWGTPYLARVFTDAALMEKLRELDESITTGMINLVTIFKVGTEEHPASVARLRKFASLLTNPKATTTLVWAHDVEMIQVGPDGKVLQYKDKYKEVKENMLVALGIPPVLMSLPYQGDEWVSILSLIERLIGWRKRVSLWAEKIIDQIIEFNDFPKDTEVKVAWERMNLVDEQAVKNLVLAFYDRGLLSPQTALKQSDQNYELEKANKKEFKPDIELFGPPNLPFSGGDEGGDKTETDKKRPEKSDVSQTTKVKTEKVQQTVNLKEQKKKAKPVKKKS